MVYIIPEVLLTIANNADSQTIHGLMLACRSFNQIIKSYERSIVKRKLEAYYHSAVDPRVFLNPTSTKNHPILQLSRETKTGAVLTSAGPKRRVTRPYSFAVVRELEIREARIASLFAFSPPNSRSDFVYRLIQGAEGSEDEDGFIVNPAVVAAQLASLKRACRVTDIMADTVAHIVARAGWVDGYNGHLAARDEEEDEERRGWHTACRCNAWISCLVGHDPAFDTLFADGRTLRVWPDLLPDDISRGRWQSKEARNEAILMSKLTHSVRTAQLALVRRLSVFDAVNLVKLAETAGFQYTARLGAKFESDAEHTEKRTAFQESIFRRGGSLSLCALDDKKEQRKIEDVFTYEMPDAVPDGALTKKLVEDAVRAIHWELFLWEQGYGFHRVAVDEVFEPVGDEGLSRLARRFDEVIQADVEGYCNGDEEGEDEEEDVEGEDGNGKARTVPAMQRGLQPTLIRCLSRMSQKGLTRAERLFAKWMRPSDGSDDDDDMSSV